MRRAALALAGLLATSGCAGGSSVERVYGGERVEGRFVEPQAYAAYLRGVIAEAGGRTAEALAEYAVAAERDPASAETWARIAGVRCAVDPRDPAADAAIARALRLDPDYAGALTARARCLLARGDTADAGVAASRAAELDPEADGANLMLDGALVRDPSAARARLVALTQTAGDPVLAWDALATWASSRGDVALATFALAELVTRAPARRAQVGKRAEALAGEGEIAAARTLAGAVVDATEAPLPRGLDLTGRLAVDEAIARGDKESLAARSSKARLPVDEAAGRALLGGRPDLARQLLGLAARADPLSRGVRLALAVATGADLRRAAEALHAGEPPVAAAALMAYATALARVESGTVAAELLGRIVSDPIVPGDDRVERPAVALAAHGLLPDAKLDANGRVELAALRGDGSPIPGAGLDERHELLALALDHGDAGRASQLSKRAAVDDAIAAAARALIALGGTAPLAPDLPRRVLSLNAADPLLAGVALRLAERTGDTDLARRARASLEALGEAHRGKLGG